MTRKQVERFKAPDLSNATPEFLVDEIGYLRDQKKQIEKAEGFYKEALTSRLTEGEREVTGETYVATLNSQTQERLSSEPVRAFIERLQKADGQQLMVTLEEAQSWFKTITFDVLRTEKL